MFYIIGVIALGIGILMIYLRKKNEDKIFLIKKTETKKANDLQTLCAEIASEIGAGSFNEITEVTGIIKTNNPIQSELANRECVHYSFRVIREWEEEYYTTDQQGNRIQQTRRGSDTVSSNSRSTNFHIEDNTGQIEINPNGADIESIKVLDDFRPGGDDRGGSLSFGGLSFNVPSLGSGRRTLGYRYEEYILPTNVRAFVLGEATDSSGQLMVQQPKEEDDDEVRRFLISTKSEAEILKAAASKSKMFFIISIIAFVAAVGFIIYGILYKGDSFALLKSLLQ